MLLSNGLSRQNRGYTSSASQTLLSQLEEKLIANQRLFLSYDYLSPQQSHLLRVSLADFLPPSQTNPYTNNARALVLPSVLDNARLPRGHHLVYFPPHLPSSKLVPDGCDLLHSPGSPFNRRMWAGGSVRFRDQHGGLLLNGQRAVCLEGVRDVRITGKEGEEKVFVGIERRVAIVEEKEDEKKLKARLWTATEEDWGDASVIEKRNLVFMRDKPPEELEAEKGSRNEPKRIVRGKSLPRTPTNILISAITDYESFKLPRIRPSAIYSLQRAHCSSVSPL